MVDLKVLHDSEKPTGPSVTQQGKEPDTVKEHSTEHVYTSLFDKKQYCIGLRSPSKVSNLCSTPQ